jgi:hypothetical protein
MRGAIPPLLHTSSWRGAQLKHGDKFNLPLTLLLLLLLLLLLNKETKIEIFDTNV